MAKNQVEQLIKGEVITARQMISSDVGVAKKELDNVITALSNLEANWDPLTLTAAKEHFQVAQANISAAVAQLKKLQQQINAILREAI